MGLAHVDLIIRNAHVVSMDGKDSEYALGAIAVNNGRIVAVEAEAAVLARYNAADVLDAMGGIVLPGFVNTHCHAAMVQFRGLADDCALDTFLQKVWTAENSFLTPDIVRAAATLGAAEMAKGGVTRFVDMYWHPEQTVAAARHVGLGIVAGPVFVGFPGVDRKEWQTRLEEARSFAASVPAEPDVALMLMPHSAYTIPKLGLRDIAELSAELKMPVHIHAAEAPAEMAAVADQHGIRPVELLADMGLLDQGAIIAHGVHVNDRELELLADNAAAISHCPLSNAKLASGTMRMRALLDANICVSLGTDGASSGNDLDMWKAMRHAAMMQMLANGNPMVVGAREILRAATIGGAEAIGMAAETGSLEVGKRADITVLSPDGLHLQPYYDAVSALVYSAGRDDVRHVFTSGRAIVRDGRLVADVSAEISEVHKVAGHIRRKGGNH